MSDSDTTSSGPRPTAASASGSPKYATFEKFVAWLPTSEKVSVFKLYDLARKGSLPVYRLAGTKSACVNIEEARAVLSSLSAQGKIRRGYGSFGPDAVVRDLSMVALPPGEVLR